MAALLRAAKATTEFVFVDGPYEVPYEPTSDEHIQRMSEMSEAESEELKQSVAQFAWWNFERKPDSDSYSYIGIEHALDYLDNIVRTQGPFDGVFGFSQGGICAAYMLARQAQGDTRFNFSFGVFSAAALMTDSKYKIEVDTPLSMPSLHIMGEQDELISIEKSRLLAAQFTNPTLLPHPGGHYIPTQKEPRTVWKTFFEEQVKVNAT
ncbi:Aste57867_25155 [Aphanomyces stellatus]|uniref:Aste57867_25155 protein n=1 Tax=Aphanomyces stellatus TaxID=120398 RepID=A0A485LT32_9STRA|nr:hypothetical protein As57867_025077 [Aphanomyces stellatus]VFU01784.1 Aste57867_25155 [Aphanomyces stellatus]